VHVCSDAVQPLVKRLFADAGLEVSEFTYWGHLVSSRVFQPPVPATATVTWGVLRAPRTDGKEVHKRMRSLARSPLFLRV
jgi:hypothetical protein